MLRYNQHQFAFLSSSGELERNGKAIKSIRDYKAYLHRDFGSHYQTIVTRGFQALHHLGRVSSCMQSLPPPSLIPSPSVMF
jgi:hypothetical protein